MEHPLMTVRDVAEYMRLAEQTIQRYVLKREIPFHKVGKVIRFRFSEVERWINEGGGKRRDSPEEGRQGDLFAETEQAGTDRETEAGKEAGESEGTGANKETGEDEA
jgi:excisionase family DNA binding protein